MQRGRIAMEELWFVTLWWLMYELLWLMRVISKPRVRIGGRSTSRLHQFLFAEKKWVTLELSLNLCRWNCCQCLPVFVSAVTDRLKLRAIIIHNYCWLWSGSGSESPRGEGRFKIIGPKNLNSPDGPQTCRLFSSEKIMRRVSEIYRLFNTFTVGIHTIGTNCRKFQHS